jgi:glycosyltransferase involved in cell wall biosynthesis
VARHADVRAAQPRRGCILLSGSFTWRPTLQGLRWFIENVMPLIAQGAGDLDLEFRIAGRMYPTLVEELSTVPGLVVVPNPPDMRSELARAHVIAVPVLASSGVRVRIYEAWAAGRPVVTTPSGALGLQYASGEELVAAAQPRDFADGVLRLVRDAALWQHVRETALRRVADFDWPRIVEGTIALHERVFPDPAAIVGASLGGVPS